MDKAGQRAGERERERNTLQQGKWEVRLEKAGSIEDPQPPAPTSLSVIQRLQEDPENGESQARLPSYTGGKA